MIDPQGALRIVGKNKTTLTLTIQKALRVFGGMMMDFSKDPEGSCDVQLLRTPASQPELLFSDGCKILWKGSTATNKTPNVALRVVYLTNAVPETAAAPPPKPIPFTLGPKMLFESEGVRLEGFEIVANGIDGSGLKFNERCTFRDCHFLRSPVTFSSCKKIEFEGNVIQDSPTHGVYIYSVSNSRLASNVFERCASSAAAVQSYGSSDCELVGNVIRNCYYGMNLVASSDCFINDNRFLGNQYGMFLNSCTRISGQRSAFDSNAVYHLYATFASPGEPHRFYDYSFANYPTSSIYSSVAVDGAVSLDLINTPLQSYMTNDNKGYLAFSAYIDVFVTNDQNIPLGRVPLRVLEGAKVVATSRTEAVGPMTGHTPLPSSHRPLVVPWFKYAPSVSRAKPTGSITYQLEADGTTLGYVKQTVPLVVDATFIRTDPEKPTKTIHIKLAKK